MLAHGSHRGYTNAMRISGLLITHHLGDEAVGWFSRLRNVVDELVAFVDEEKASPELLDRLRHLDARILKTDNAAFYNFDFKKIIAACEGDWVLKVDYDEELSLEWDDPRWREMLETTEFTHFWSPRRWITPAGGYLTVAPWWPDWQIRLFRKSPEEIIFPTRLHETMQMKGGAGYLRTLAIHHHDLRLASRQSREQKARSYEKERPGNSLGYYYLFEDYAVPQMRLPRTSEFEPGRELLRMDRLKPEEVKNISLHVPGVPKELRPGELVWLDVEITNNTARALLCGAPFPVNLAYHWLGYPARDTITFDGERTAILPELAPKNTGQWKMFVIAPQKPGDYLLQVTMVQEQVRWFEEVDPDFIREFRITVTPE
ncbi:MAG: lipopolysaccharide transport system ATP-binding protein [Verrucomicrobiota bacterium]